MHLLYNTGQAHQTANEHHLPLHTDARSPHQGCYFTRSFFFSSAQISRCFPMRSSVPHLRSLRPHPTDAGPSWMLVRQSHVAAQTTADPAQKVSSHFYILLPSPVRFGEEERVCVCVWKERMYETRKRKIHFTEVDVQCPLPHFPEQAHGHSPPRWSCASYANQRHLGPLFRSSPRG